PEIVMVLFYHDRCAFTKQLEQILTCPVRVHEILADSYGRRFLLPARTIAHGTNSTLNRDFHRNDVYPQMNRHTLYRMNLYVRHIKEVLYTAHMNFTRKTNDYRPIDIPRQTKEEESCDERTVIRLAGDRLRHCVRSIPHRPCGGAVR